MTKKNKRSVKVYGMSGYKYKTTPTIMLKGQWLAELGSILLQPIRLMSESRRRLTQRAIHRPD